MIRAILASTVLHGLLISMILLFSVKARESGAFADTRMRIRISSSPNEKHTPVSSASKSKISPRDLLTSPQEGTPDIEEGSMSDESFDELAALLEYEPLLSPRSKPGEQVQSIEIMDPLVNFDEQANSKSSLHGPLLIDWVNGRERGILSFPVIDVAKFPQNSEKLLGVVIRIRVSPQGEVLSAELVPPGSGDTRIDRYMHSAALQLTLEPLLEGEEVQEALLRLRFLEDSL